MPWAFVAAIPPAVAELSVGSGGQNKGVFLNRAAISFPRSIRLMPGSTVISPVPSSSRTLSLTLFIWDRFMTCPPLGTPAPVIPVFPPWIVTGTRPFFSSRSTSCISSWLSGKEMLSAYPENFDSSIKNSSYCSFIV